MQEEEEDDEDDDHDRIALVDPHEPVLLALPAAEERQWTPEEEALLERYVFTPGYGHDFTGSSLLCPFSFLFQAADSTRAPIESPLGEHGCTLSISPLFFSSSSAQG
jgi:hypothetical protein